MLKASNNPVFNKFTEQNWKVLDAVQEVATQLGRSPAQIALNWVATQPVPRDLYHHRRHRLAEQLEDNLAALSFAIPPELRQRLDEASALDDIHPYMFFGEVLQARVRGGVKVKRWKEE